MSDDKETKVTKPKVMTVITLYNQSGDSVEIVANDKDLWAKQGYTLTEKPKAALSIGEMMSAIKRQMNGL